MTVCDWIIHRRNYAVFYIQIANSIYELHEAKLIKAPRELLTRFIFLILKKHTMILFKLYRRLKFNEPDKYKYFNKSDFEIFFKSEERKLLFSFVKFDLNISKPYFDECLK